MGSADLPLPETASKNRYNESTSHHLGELLRFREDNKARNNVSSKSLGSVLNLEKRSSPEIRSGRTLLDIIQADSTGESKKTWKYFRDKLRLKRANAAWQPRSDMERANSIGNNSMNNRMMLRRPSTRIPTSDPDIDSPSGRTKSSLLQKSISSLSSEESPEKKDSPANEGNETPQEDEEGGGGEGSAKMSLMALLAENDREMGLESSYMMGDDEEEEDDENGESGENDESGDYNNCCVCMVRHKGSAFVPCGHAFCRLCSRELHVQKGNCPLCNGYIVEILDIF